MKKKLFLLICLILFLFLSPKSVSALLSTGEENLGGSSTLKTFQETIENARASGEMPRERWIGDPQGSVLSNMVDGIFTLVGGELNWKLFPEVVANKNTKIDYDKIFITKGALGFSTNLVASLFKPPVSSVEYFADLGSKLGIAKPAYAQGVGFSGLSNLLPLWKAFRDVSYFFFVIIFIVIGLAIMFRVKLDPKTVITVQNALPKMVIALILITFSYAIAGLMIDLIYVLINIGIVAIGRTGWIGDAAGIAYEQGKYTNLSLIEGVGLVIGTGAEALNGVLSGWLGSLSMEAILGMIGFHLAGFIGLTAGIALLLAIIAIISLYCIFKLFLALIMCYINIILSVITAPIQIMLGILPGSEQNFNSWFKNLMANILAFPAVTLVILLGWLLVNQEGPTWAPPIIGTGRALTGILGFGMLLLLPKIPDMIKNAFKMKPSGYGTAIAEPLQAAYKVGAAGYKAYQEKTRPGIEKRARDEAKYKDLVESHRSSPPRPDSR